MKTQCRKANETKNRNRKNYLINKPFQMKHILAILLVQVLTVVFTSIVATYLIYFVLDTNAVQISHNYGFLLQWGIMLLTALVIGAFLIVKFTHNIAGPIYQACRQLNDAANGDIPSEEVVFRKKDHFKELQNNLNECFKTMRTYKHAYDKQNQQG